MPIPESQLERWSHQGAVTTARQTHESIREALSAYQLWPPGIDYEVYLQGSYKNATNIRGDSDVDVVVQLKSTFLSNLSENQQRLFRITPATYDWQTFKSDVLHALRNYFKREKVSEGRKSIKVQTSYLPADVVVCLQYRKYPQYPKNADDYLEGITFCVLGEGRWVINYPKLHYDNGVQKNAPSRTNGWYKPTVRLFKNARTYLVERKVIPSDLAPSYFLECFLYNVPDSKYGSSFRDTFCNVVKWLVTADFGRFVSQNEQLPLFGDSPEQWSEEKACRFVKAMVDLWNNWR
ncbi:MAG: nucleotidyltransferase domain-containing protein [Acidobacteriota bacterium]|uniref:tRNA nucleotidyltransferase (CCA-adding enzyme) n=1 Tax=Thermoanaerobaculum aquaticum TaxID=1312852 RepID=A0A062XZM5_9BACT|nr:nucleotidyltransferase [Thermoanaerobaculum aquaticum]KDA54869.1 tRNA nucleotidyltransferase (CCA-adding enzyme) [Thermoanaerobaculum aquaticum]